MKTSWFYTIFWMLYFPLCIAFYEDINFDWIDEILTAVLILFGIAKGTFMLKSRAPIMKEVWTYLGLMTFYVVYSLITAVNVEESVWMDLQQQVRPYAVFYVTWIMAPKFGKWQKNLILVTMVVSTIVYVPRSVGIENPVLGQLCMVSAMAWYLFKPHTHIHTIIASAIMILGLLSGKSKFVGEFVAFIAIAYFLKGRIQFTSRKFVLQFTALAVVILFFTWTRFNTYYVEGFTGDERRARPESYKTAVTIMADYFPFGSGLGSFATNAAWRYYSPLYPKYNLDTVWGLDPCGGFICDAYYPTLAEFGVFGFVFFIIFWKRRIRAAIHLPDVRYYKMGLMCILALALESTSDSSYLSGKGMGYFMLLAICLASGGFDTISSMNSKNRISRLI